MNLPHEDRAIFGVWSPNVATAIEAINMIGCAHLLLHVVPGDQATKPPGCWLLFKDDSWLRQQWRERFPGAEVFPRYVKPSKAT
jgi:hypothetical protein